MYVPQSKTCTSKNTQITWTFGCPGHGKGTWDGLGGIIKNKTGHYIKAMDSFIGTPYGVYTIIEELFASEAAKKRFNDAKHIKIKEWIILWCADTELNRPEKNLSGKKTAETSTATATATDEVNVVTENKFTDLYAFHKVGTRGLFYFKAEHRDGMSVKLSGCHCRFCIRDYRPQGMGTIPLGCLSQEPSQYLVFQRLDDNWVTEKKKLMEILEETLVGRVRENDIIAIASVKSSNNVMSHFRIAKVVAINENNAYTVNFYRLLPSSEIKGSYEILLPLTDVLIQHCGLRTVISASEAQITHNSLTLSNDCVERIIKNCFNGK